MWMANRKPAEGMDEPAAELGEITFAGGGTGVALGGERRSPAVCSPSGYYWAPKNGDTVLVIKSGAEGNPCVAGRIQGEADAPAPGEIWLSAASGAGIRLKPDGSIEFTGDLKVTGSLTVEGRVRMGDTVTMTGSVTANGQTLGQTEGV